MKSQNFWDFAFEQKRKNKTKSFCLACSWKSDGFLSWAAHNAALCVI
ncbi:hypothetical protein FB2170_09486 [Maribacter sp. HTCC2170]|nr:hypothetical protein FB2170_09486 [Maribacter sp. HTCC2170]